MNDSRVTVIKGSCTSTLSWNEMVAKQKMTGVAALQSYLENRFANLHYRGGSFATLDRKCTISVVNSKTEAEKQMRG